MFLGLFPNRRQQQYGRVIDQMASGSTNAPSAGISVLNQGLARAQQNAASQAAASTANPVLAMRNAGLANQRAASEAIGQAADIRSREQLAALQQQNSLGAQQAAGMNNLFGTLMGAGEGLASLGALASGVGATLPIAQAVAPAVTRMIQGSRGSTGSGYTQAPGPGTDSDLMAGVDRAIGYDGTDPTQALISGANAPQPSQPSQSFLDALAGPRTAPRRRSRPRAAGTPAVAPPTAPVVPVMTPAPAAYDPSLPMSQLLQDRSPEGIDDEALRQRLYMQRLYRNAFAGGAAPMSVQPQMYSPMQAPQAPQVPQLPWSMRRGY